VYKVHIYQHDTVMDSCSNIIMYACVQYKHVILLIITNTLVIRVHASSQSCGTISYYRLSSTNCISAAVHTVLVYGQ